MFALEKRGYVKAGPWTPEAATEHPEAGEKFNFKWLLYHPSYKHSVRDTVKVDVLACLPYDMLCLFFSATAAQGVPQGRGQRHADLHLLRQ